MLPGWTTRWAVARPNGVTGKLPVVVVLHALNTNERTIFSRKLQMQNVLQKYVDDGNRRSPSPPSTVPSTTGTAASDGADSGAMVLDEFLPMLASNTELNLSTERIGFTAGRWAATAPCVCVPSSAPPRAAVSVSSPALWADPHAYHRAHSTRSRTTRRIRCSGIERLREDPR